MKKLLQLTISADVASCLIASLFLMMTSSNQAIAMLLFGTGYLFVPTLLGVFVFLWIRNQTTLNTRLNTLVFQTMILLFFFLVGALVWAIVDVLFFDKLHVQPGGLMQELESEFMFWLPELFFLSFFIPFMDYVLDKLNKTSGKI